MTESLPIACSLRGDELPRRLAEIAALGRAALISVERGGARSLLRFQPSSANRAELERIVAAESSCCSFLRLELEDQPSATTLTIEAPPGGEPVMHELVDAFAAGSPSAASRTRS
jgi:hypothetical protein